MDVDKVKTEFLEAAQKAAQEYFDKHLGGVDQYACGFAWITVYPRNKGNTKLGRAERVILRDLGFTLDYTGKNFQFWNPSKMGCQNVDTKEAGANAGAEVLRRYGLDAFGGSRLD